MARKSGMSVVLAYLTLCLVWGTTYLAIKVALEGLGPFMMLGIRFLIAGLVLVPVLFRQGARLPQDRREWTAVIVAGLFMLLGANSMVTLSEVYIESGLTALTVATNPAWAALIGGWLFSREERFGKWGLVGVGLAMAGVAILHHDHWNVHSAEWPGVLAACIAPILWATGSLIARHHIRHSDPLSTTALQMLSSAPFFFPLAALAREPWTFTPSVRVIAALLFLALFGSVLTYVAYVWLAQRMPVSRVVTYTYVNPIVALLLGYFVLGESIHVEVYPATLLILGGMLLIYMTSARRIATH